MLTPNILNIIICYRVFPILTGSQINYPGDLWCLSRNFVSIVFYFCRLQIKINELSIVTLRRFIN